MRKGVVHVIAEDLVDRSTWLGALRACAGFQIVMEARAVPTEELATI